MKEVFTIEKLRPIKDDMTISRDSKLSDINRIIYFSLGKNTDISPEKYDSYTLYIGNKGSGTFILDENFRELEFKENDILIVSNDMLCGNKTVDGLIYTEVNLNKEKLNMNCKIKANEVFALKDLIDYEEGSIVNLDVVSNNTMKYVLMAFDEGTGLSEHRAPGNAIVFALDGSATIGYEGKEYQIKEGECFKFEKNGLHSISANKRFKMALLLVIE